MRKKIIPVLQILAILAAFCLLYMGGRYLEKRKERPEPKGTFQIDITDSAPMVMDGVTYQKKDSVTAVLLMGIDHSSTSEIIGARNGGQADFLQLLVVDYGQKRMTRVPIDRDTMTPVAVLGVLGNRSGVRTMQVCLAHGFGDGKEQSCRLTVEAVSNLLLNVPVSFYAAMDLDGIEVFNEAVGGVTVTMEDDLSALDPAMIPGAQITLRGKQAELFVRSRMTVGEGTNEERMRRQNIYLKALYDAMKDRFSADVNYSGRLYDTLSPYLITDLSRGRIINTLSELRDFELTEMNISGEHRIGQDGFMQFYPDERSIQQTVLSLFYEKR